MKDEPKINANRQKKIDLVTILSEKFEKAKAVVFTNYQGLTHKQIESLKKAIKPLEADFVVAKNSLVSRSLQETYLKLEGEHLLEGPTGTLFLYNDIVAPLKALAKLIKELNLPNVKFGIMDKDFITGEQVLKLATLPSRETLLTQVAFGLKSPILGLHKVLNWNLQKLVMTLNAIIAAKPALATAASHVAQPVSEPVAKPVAETLIAEPQFPIEGKTEEQPSEPAENQDSTSEEVKN